nr:MAG TPA: hypothetical protein [Caudoviricetes sp.]DAX73250.1 MAG TPA: hypothetical protein [Caudoviricetes sp.]
MNCENCPNRDYCIPDECIGNGRPLQQQKTAKTTKN